jgi:hypothetical protein
MRKPNYRGYSPYRYNNRPPIDQEQHLSAIKEYRPVTTLDLCEEQEDAIFTSYGRDMHEEDRGYDPARYDGDDNLPLDVLEHFSRRGKVRW